MPWACSKCKQEYHKNIKDQHTYTLKDAGLCPSPGDYDHASTITNAQLRMHANVQGVFPNDTGNMCLREGCAELCGEFTKRP
jgi:hypothetical protein